MKVLETSKWEAEIECKHCTSRLLVTEIDLKWAYFGSGYRHDPNRRVYFTCIACNQDNIIRVPNYIKERVRDSCGGRVLL